MRPLSRQVRLGCHDRVTGCSPTLNSNRTAGLRGRVGAGPETLVKSSTESCASPQLNPCPAKTESPRAFFPSSRRKYELQRGGHAKRCIYASVYIRKLGKCAYLFA